MTDTKQAAASDDKNAYLMCEELALAAWDCIADPASADTIALRKSATACLFATKSTPRPALTDAARTLAFAVIDWI
jgi:hypothetical protein